MHIILGLLKMHANLYKAQYFLMKCRDSMKNNNSILYSLKMVRNET